MKTNRNLTKNSEQKGRDANKVYASFSFDHNLMETLSDESGALTDVTKCTLHLTYLP